MFPRSIMPLSTARYNSTSPGDAGGSLYVKDPGVLYGYRDLVFMISDDLKLFLLSVSS